MCKPAITICVWHHHDHFPFFQNHSCNSCALASAFGPDKQSKCCHTHRVVVIAIKSKGNNNKPILKVLTTQTIATTKRYIPLCWCVCLPSHGHVTIHSARGPRDTWPGCKRFCSNHLHVPSNNLILQPTPTIQPHKNHTGILCKNLGIPKIGDKKVPIKPDSILHL
jgi:hypothetical protein